VTQGRSSVRDRLAGPGSDLAWACARRLPEPVATRLLRRLPGPLMRNPGGRLDQLRRNLRRAAPGLSQDRLELLLAGAIGSYLRYWYEVARIGSWPAERVVGRVVAVNQEAVRDARARTGAVVALPHMANWDHAAAWATRTGMPVTAVAERLQPPRRYQRFAAYRERLGMDLVALDTATPVDRWMWSRLRSAVAGGRLVCLVSDRDLVGRGTVVELLGEPARLPTGPAALAAGAGATLFAATLAYQGPLLRIEFSGPIGVSRRGSDVRRATQTVADWFSRGITRSPEDWHMMQPVFTSDLPGAGGER
jgi:phosphatidylinositol dimannoside acyltransferase